MRATCDRVQSRYCHVPGPRLQDDKAVYLHDHNVPGIKEDGTGIRVFWKESSGEGDCILTDALVDTDGPSSTVRNILRPEVQRGYARYCAIRGTTSESQVSQSARDAFCERFTFFHGPGVQMLAYLVSGQDGATEPGRRLINSVCCTNSPEASLELEEIITGKNGMRHRITAPPVWRIPKHRRSNASWLTTRSRRSFPRLSVLPRSRFPRLSAMSWVPTSI